MAVMYEDGSLLSKADCGDNFEICCKVQTPLYDTQQPAPDVSALVEALEACRDELKWMIERHNQQDQNDGSWLYDHQTVVEADAALATHRKQGDRP